MPSIKFKGKLPWDSPWRQAEALTENPLEISFLPWKDKQYNTWDYSFSYIGQSR